MSSFYSALGENDAAYLLARVLQLFVPGIPQVYYVGALFGSNDLEALKADGDPRSANRHDYTETEIAEKVAEPRVQEFLEILRFRARDPRFDGEFSLEEPRDGLLLLTWSAGGSAVTLRADLAGLSYVIVERRESEPPVELFRSIPGGRA